MSRNIGLTLLALLLFTGTARAANESVRISVAAEPGGEKLFREVERPVRANLDVAVDVPEGVENVTPMIFSKVTFPPEMSFHPDPARTPVCPIDKVGPQTNLALGVARIVDLCPDSVIGTGRATINLAQSNRYPLADPELVIFNAGRTRDGPPRLTIYGFSKGAGAGLFMSGFLDKNNALGISIGVLPFDSSISNFTIGIPGDPMRVEDGTAPGGFKEVVGKDPNYLRAVCPKRSWRATGEFNFATRDTATGELTSNETTVASNPFDLPCEGRPGSPKLKRPKVSGPMAFRPGQKKKYRVTLTNTGTATAKGITVRIGGAGRGTRKIAALKPGATTSVWVRVRFTKSERPRNRLTTRVVGAGGVPTSTLKLKVTR